MGDIAKMLAQKEQLTPKKGFRLVGLDDFEDPGEQLYPISEHDTREEAEAARKASIANGAAHGNYDKIFIYGPDDNQTE